MALSHRLKELMGEERGSQAAFCKKVGIAQSMLTRYLKDTEPSAEVIRKIVAAYHVNYEWFLEGKGGKSGRKRPIEIQVMTAGEQSLEVRKATDTIAIPCPAVAHAGEAIIPEEYLDRLSEKHYLFRKRFLDKVSAHGDWICILIDEREGDSMSPILTPGDLVLVDRNLKPYLGSPKMLIKKLNGTLAILADPDSSGLFVKRIWIDPEGRLTAHSDNHAFAPKTFDLEDQDIQQILVGRVVWRGHKL